MIKGLLAFGCALAFIQPVAAGFYYGDALKSFCENDIALPYVLGVHDAWEFAKLAGADGGQICLPEGTGGRQITQAVCNYADSLTTEELKSSAGIIVLAGLTTAFPCE